MQIILEKISKKYKHDIIFRELSLVINKGDKLGISGPNGSGKSTLLKIISGQTSPSKGIRIFKNDADQLLDEELVFSKFSYAAPYIELIEEFTLPELLKFYSGFRKCYLLSLDELAEISGIAYKNRYIKDFSSGMKQRVKILLALCFESEVVMLDEPSTNLDTEGITWTKAMINNYLFDRTLIIASNELNDFTSTQKVLDIRDFK